jgi:predicted nucleic acid-binding protein
VNQSDLVLIDTGVWAAFFSKPGSAEKQVLDRLIDQDRIALTGPIITEVLRGFRRIEQADWVASRLQLAHYLEPAWDDWRNAAALGRELASKGNDLPITDLVVASLALRLRTFVFSSDPHFNLIPGLKRYP